MSDPSPGSTANARAKKITPRGCASGFCATSHDHNTRLMFRQDKVCAQSVPAHAVCPVDLLLPWRWSPRRSAPQHRLRQSFADRIHQRRQVWVFSAPLIQLQLRPAMIRTLQFNAQEEQSQSVITRLTELVPRASRFLSANNHRCKALRRCKFIRAREQCNGQKTACKKGQCRTLLTRCSVRLSSCRALCRVVIAMHLAPTKCRASAFVHDSARCLVAFARISLQEGTPPWLSPFGWRMRLQIL